MSRTPRTLLLALAVAAPLALTAQGAATAAHTAPSFAYELPAEATFPEGVAVQDGLFYTGSTTDGVVYVGAVDQDPDGDDTDAEPLLDNGSTAIGIKATEDRLFVAGGGQGTVSAYDRATGALIATYSNATLDGGETFVNDVAIGTDGFAYATDSQRPVLYRLPVDGTTSGPLEVFVDLRGTAFEYQAGFNANGIAVTDDGRYAYVVQSNTGELFRVDLRTRAVRQVAVRGAALTNGDGLLLEGGSLYVLRNAQEQLVELKVRGLSAKVLGRTTDETFMFPTTLAADGTGRLLVVNSQFDQRGGSPQTPFTLSSIPTP